MYRMKNTYKNRNVGSVAESNVENWTVLREVDLLPAKHGGGGLGNTKKHINVIPYGTNVIHSESSHEQTKSPCHVIPYRYPVLGIQIRIRMFLGLPDPDPLIIKKVRIRIFRFSHKGVERTEIMLVK